MVTWLQIQFFLVIGMGFDVTEAVTNWLHWLHQILSYNKRAKQGHLTQPV